jgi:hypothetical protein
MKKAFFFWLLFLCGCAPQKMWFSPAKNYAEAEQDYRQCQSMPAGSGYSPPSDSAPGRGAGQQTGTVAECMKAKGYYLVDKKFADVYRNAK